MHALCSSAAIDGWPLASCKTLAVVQTVVARCIPSSPRQGRRPRVLAP